MRRWSWVPLLSLVLVAASCIPAPPPAWVAPTVLSIDVAPGPVVAGAPFTVAVTASDDHVVWDINIEIRPPYRLNPATDKPYPHVQCAATTEVVPGPLVTREFSCTLPSFVPNGSWNLDVTVADDGHPYQGHATRTFEVVGGSEDRAKPVFELAEVSPDTVVAGVPFNISLQVSDEHPSSDPVQVTVANIVDVQAPNPAPWVQWDCGFVTPTTLTPTLQEMVFTCLVGPEAALGSYSAFVRVEDAIGHDTVRRISFQVVAPS